MTPKVTAIVIAQPDRFRESIQVLLTSISQIDEVLPFESVTDALSLAVNFTPSLAILDHQVASIDLHSTLRLLRDAWQEASRIILVEDKEEFQLALELHTDLVLVKGFNASKFIDSVEEILKNR